MSKIDHSQSPDHAPDFWQPNPGSSQRRAYDRRQASAAREKAANEIFAPVHTAARWAIAVVLIVAVIAIGSQLLPHLPH